MVQVGLSGVFFFLPEFAPALPFFLCLPHLSFIIYLFFVLLFFLDVPLFFFALLQGHVVAGGEHRRH